MALTRWSTFTIAVTIAASKMLVQDHAREGAGGSWGGGRGVQGCGGPKRGVTWGVGGDRRPPVVSHHWQGSLVRHHGAKPQRPRCFHAPRKNGRLAALRKAKKARYAESKRNQHADAEVDQQGPG